MARLPYGAVTLIGDVKAIKPKAKIEEFGDPDGLAVYRTIKFDKRTSDWLTPLLDRIEDPRIKEAKVTDAGYLHVTFSDRPIADNKDHFPLADAEAVLRDEGGDSEEPPAPPRQEPEQDSAD